jgi:hypothetical protein
VKTLFALIHVALYPAQAEGLIWPLVAGAFFFAAWLRWLGA